jgi:alpha-mannosidase
LYDYFTHTDDPGRLWTFHAREYLTPFLIQAVARQERDPQSRFARHTQRRHEFDAGRWYGGLARALCGKPPDVERRREVEQIVEDGDPDATPEDEQEAIEAVARFVPAAARELAGVLMSGAGGTRGALVLNPLSFARTVVVPLDSFPAPPAVGGTVKGVQFDDSRKDAVVEVPGSGFAWIAAGEPGATASQPKAISTPLAEGAMLRNELLEVYINEETGGIAQIKDFGRSPNRLSQQLAYRFPRERTVTVGADDATHEVRTCYSEMVCTSLRIACAGPALGEIVTTGRIVDQTNQSTLADFRQTVRVWRKRSIVEVDVELDPRTMPDGDPWNNYYGVRFAWNDSTASLTRSLQQGAHGFQGERFESPYYLEIASDDERITILNRGLSFHRKTGPRMVDTILIPAGESERRFRFGIAFDADYPMEAAMDVLVPAAVVPTETGPPRSGASGWFFHLDVKNVQIIGIENVLPAEDWAAAGRETPPAGGFALRLLETEGRQRKVRLSCFKTPRRARQRDFQGQTLAQLPIEDDAVVVSMNAYEIADVELLF